MIGDIYISLKDFIKQNFCKHEYRYHPIGIPDQYGYWKCKKCGRVKE